jgi:outer membrane protein assembly factor BamA
MDGGFGGANRVMTRFRAFQSQITAAVLCVCVWMITPVARASAQHGSAQRRTEDVRVKSVHLEGVNAVDAGELKSVLATKASGWLPWGEKHLFSQEDFNDDLKRIRAFYADRGYPAAKVLDHNLEYNEAKDEVDITIRVEEGPPVVIQSVDFFGFDVLPVTTINFLKRTLTLKAGEVRRQGDLVA